MLFLEVWFKSCQVSIQFAYVLINLYKKQTKQHEQTHTLYTLYMYRHLRRSKWAQSIPLPDINIFNPFYTSRNPHSDHALAQCKLTGIIPHVLEFAAFEHPSDIQVISIFSHILSTKDSTPHFPSLYSNFISCPSLKFQSIHISHRFVSPIPHPLISCMLDPPISHIYQPFHMSAWQAGPYHRHILGS